MLIPVGKDDSETEVGHVSCLPLLLQIRGLQLSCAWAMLMLEIQGGKDSKEEK